MGFLAGKKILITGLLSNRSIAYGIAHACKREGASLAFTYVNDDLKDRVVKLAADFGGAPVLPCDVTHDDQIAALFSAVEREWGGLDGLLHSIAFAPREALAGDFLNAISRQAFAIAHDVSSYSFAALAKGARPLMQGRQGALLTLTKNIAFSLMRDHIRVNGLNIGWTDTPGEHRIQTEFHHADPKWLEQAEARQPFGRLIKPDEVARAVAFLTSEESGLMTGSIIDFDQSVVGSFENAPHPAPRTAAE